MVEPTDVPSLDELAKQLRAGNQRHAELRRSLQEATRRLEQLTRRVDQLSCELRTRRLIVIDEAGNERIIAAADIDLATIEIRSSQADGTRVTITATSEANSAGLQLSLGEESHGAFELTQAASDSPVAQLSIGRAGGATATVLPHLVRIQRPEGPTVHMLVTPVDAELHLHSGPARIGETPESARATIHVSLSPGEWCRWR